MLPFILLMSLLCQGHALDCGTDFVTAFPENLAFYFPASLMQLLKITIFQLYTQVNVTMNGTVIHSVNISAVGVTTLNVLNAEINLLGVSGNSIRITSDKNIAVLSYNKRGDSIQANVVPPTTCLGKHYMVPSPNYTEFAVKMNSYNFSAYADPSIEPMDFSMNLLIVNAEAVINSITVYKNSPTAQSSDTFDLGPYAVILLPRNSFWYEVTSTAKVAVIITNPCMDSLNCRCNLVAHQLRPTDFLGTSFIFPPFDNTDKRLFVTSSDSVVLSSGSDTQSVAPASIGLLSFLPGQSTGGLTTTTSASVRVILPGLIIDVLPTNMFAGCFLVQTNDPTKAQVLLIVKTAEKGDIHKDSNVISTAVWRDLSDVGYSWAVISLTERSCVIWHPTSRIAVYVLETSGSGVTYGGPAISINKEPDPNGCVVVPTQFELFNITMCWQEARAYCFKQGLVMASPNINYTQEKMMASLSLMDVEGGAWLGLRRNLVTSEWNWQNAMGFTYGYWDYNQPSSNLCGSLKMAAGGNYTWSSVRCCSPMFPLCAKDMVIISSVSDPTPII